MHDLTTTAPSLAYLLTLAEDPCLWLLVLWVCDRVIVPAVKRWRVQRQAVKKEKENGS